MAPTKETGLIRNLRDRFRRTKSDQRREEDSDVSEIVRRTTYPMTEWDPVRTMREMLRWDPLRAAVLPPQLDRDMWEPRFEVRENGTALRFIADIPGVRREDLDISVTGNRLMISGHREIEERAKDETVYAYERQYGEFTRTFVLPDDMDIDHITSELRDGVLTIVVPRTGGSRSRKIPIGGSIPKS